MISEFLARLSVGARKKVALDELKRHFFSLYPEVQNSPERNARLLGALRELAEQGALTLPASGSWGDGRRPTSPSVGAACAPGNAF